MPRAHIATKQATYTLDRVGLRTQQVSNLVIGDPKDPDLTAERAVVQLRVLLTGKVEVYRIVARGVRLHGQLAGGKVSWGQIDKLLPPPSGKPFSLPNIVVDVADTTIRLDTPFGRIGVALIGSGNLSGGSKGRIAPAAPSLRPGRCSVDGLKANLAIAVNARRPHVVIGGVGTVIVAMLWIYLFPDLRRLRTFDSSHAV